MRVPSSLDQPRRGMTISWAISALDDTTRLTGAPRSARRLGPRDCAALDRRGPDDCGRPDGHGRDVSEGDGDTIRRGSPPPGLASPHPWADSAGPCPATDERDDDDADEGRSGQDVPPGAARAPRPLRPRAGLGHLGSARERALPPSGREELGAHGGGLPPPRYRGVLHDPVPDPGGGRRAAPGAGGPDAVGRGPAVHPQRRRRGQPRVPPAARGIPRPPARAGRCPVGRARASIRPTGG